MFSSLALFASLLALARAHGTVKGVQIGGTSYPGAVLLNANPSKSPVRPITNQGEPIFDVNSNAMICGTGATPAPVTAPVKAGEQVQVFWQGESVPNWFHTTGPILTYLASCNGDCSKFNPSASTSWFKISQQGESNGPGTWAQAKLLDGSPSTVTIPSDLPAGNYLMRHEIIALQNGNTLDKAEFYPACIQLAVSGGPSGRVSASPTVNFPGTYKATDPGIKVDVFTPSTTPYVFPGGAISNIGSNGGSSDSGSGNDSSSSAPSAPVNAGSNPNAPPSSTASAPTSTNTGKCKSKKAKRDAANSTANALRKRSAALSAHRKRRMLVESQ